MSAQLGGHVSSSTLSAHQMPRVGEPADSVEWVELYDDVKSKNRRSKETLWQPPAGIEVVWIGKQEEEVSGTGTGVLVSARLSSLRCLLSDGLRGEGLGTSSPLLGCHQVRGAHRTPVWTSLSLCSSSSCSTTRTWRCLSFRSSTECSNCQLCGRGVYVQCKLCKSWRFHRAVLRRCLRAHSCALSGAGDGPDSAENREVSASVLGLGSLPVVLQRQVPDGRDSAEN